MTSGISDRNKAVTEFLRLLVRGKVSRGELALTTGMSRQQVIDLVSAWKEAGLIHTSGKASDSMGRMRIDLFSFGPGEDQLSPPARSRGASTPRTKLLRGLQIELQKMDAAKRTVQRRKPLVSIPEAVREVAASE